MRPLHVWLRRFLGMFRKPRRDQELVQEIESHLQLHADDNVRAGMTPEEARRQAYLKFGPVEAVKERYRDQRGIPLLDALSQDLRAGVRTLLRHPTFSLVVVATLALGIGANAAIFSVVDAVLLRPLPYPDADRIVEVRGRSPQAFSAFGPDQFRVSPAELLDSSAFHAMALSMTGGINLGGTPAERVRVAAVTEEFFAVLGVEPLVGHAFGADDPAQTRQVAVLSHRLWQRRFAGDTAIVGASIRLNERPYVVVGVMPPRVAYPGETEVWIPNGVDFRIGERVHATTLVARLAEGVSTAQARDEVNRIEQLDALARSGRATVRPRGVTGSSTAPEPAVREAVSLRGALVGSARPIFLLVASGALLVLLVASLNAANLLLTRVASRTRELSVRRALGASPLQLARQQLIETLLLSGVAALASLPAAYWALGLVRSRVPAQLYGVQDIALNGRAFAGLGGICLLAALVSGLAPALSVRSRRSAGVLQAGSAGSEGLWRRCRSALVVAEMAAAVILLVGALALVGVVRDALAVDLGVRGGNAVVFELSFPEESYPSRDDLSSFYERLADELARIPGIEAFGATDQLPGEPDGGVVGTLIGVVGRPWQPSGDQRWADELTATPGYFEAIGIDVIAGRTFDASDRMGARPVVVVSEGYARALGVEAAELLGEQVDTSSVGRARYAEIIGVVRDVRLQGPEGDFRAALYRSFLQRPSWWNLRHAVVKGHSDPGALAAAARAAIAAVDPGLPLDNVRTFDEVIAQHLEDRRLAMATMLAFGGLALLLASAGLYAVLAYLVRLRRREIGVRLALGAAPARVRREVLASGVRHALAGCMVGLAGCAAILRLASAGVAGVGPFDLGNAVLVSCSIGVVAVLATWMPAARATRVDPVSVLRVE